MKKVFLLICILISLASTAQPPGYTKFYVKYNFLNLTLDSTLTAPAGASARLTVGAHQRSGAIYVDTVGADSGFYYYSRANWQKLAVNGISGRFGSEDVTTTTNRGFSLNAHNLTITGTGSSGVAAHDTVLFKNSVVMLQDSGIGIGSFITRGHTFNGYGDYQTKITPGLIEFRHFSNYKTGCTTCGLNSMVMYWYQNAGYPTGGTDTLLHGMGAHNGPGDRHFFLADFTGTYPSNPTNHLMTVEKNGTPFMYMGVYDNGMGSLSMGNPATFSGYDNYRFMVDLKAGFADTVNFFGKVFIPNITNFADTTTYKPLVFNTSNNRLYKATYWPQATGTVNAIGTINSQPKSSNGAVITGSNIILQQRDASYDGLMTVADLNRLWANFYNQIDKAYDSLAWGRNDSTLKIKSLRIQRNGSTVTPTTTDSTLSYDLKDYGCWIIAASDETTSITTGTAKLTFRVPFACTVTGVRASLTTESSSGIPTFDINETGTTILSTKLTIDASEKTSTTAATAAVISDSSLADDAEITIDFDVAGTGAKGVKIYIYYRR